MLISSINVLVTGGAGYIGSHTVARLIAAGYRVTVVDTLCNGHPWAIHKEATFYEVSVADKASMLEIMENGEFYAVFHFAAYTSVPESITHPEKYYENNVVASRNLLECVQKSGIPCLVFSSSAAVYGIHRQNLIGEDARAVPINPYGHTKLMIENEIRGFHAQYVKSDTPRYVILRYFNVAGAQHDGRLGQVGSAENLIKVVCEAALKKREGVDIFGTSHDTPDGTCVRDYVHVEDVAEAHLRSLKYLDEGGSSTIFNCCSGHGHSVREVIEKIQEISGVYFQVRASPARPGDLTASIGDPEKIRSLLKWEPRYSSLDLICESALRWEQQQYPER